MAILKKYWRWIVALLIVGFFIWTRFHNIDSSLMFFNDMGRDSLVIWDWITSGKPPLLGPQTSAMPFNQGPIYYYLLFPFFVLSHFSGLSHLYLMASVYIGLFIFGLWCLRKNPKMQNTLLGFSILVCLHPQYIIQNRFVWNPSLITPFLTLGVLGLWYLMEKETKWRYLAWSIGMGVGVTLSYSLAPIMLVCLAYVLAAKRKIFVKTLICLIGVLAILNLPMLVFEIRHGFLLTKSVLAVKGPVQYYSGFFEGVTLMSEYVIGSGNLILNKVIFLGSLAFAAAVSLWSKNKLSKFLSIILLASTLMMLSMKMTIHSHYIFGYLTLIFLILNSVSLRMEIFTIGLFIILFGQMWKLNSYFSPARRTYQQMDRCMALVCDEEKNPIYVSTQADFHNYHNGPEYRYLLKKNGCDVKYIESQPETAKRMAIVLENSDFEIDKTSYNELSLFGPAKEIKRLICDNYLKVVIIEKK